MSFRTIVAAVVLLLPAGAGEMACRLAVGEDQPGARRIDLHARIEAAMGRGREYLLRNQRATGWSASSKFTKIGDTAYVLLGLASAGVRRQHRPVLRALESLRAPLLKDLFVVKEGGGSLIKATYSLSILAMAVEVLSRKRAQAENGQIHKFSNGDRLLLKKIGRWLVAHQVKQGGWGYPGFGHPSVSKMGSFDVSNTAFAMLALRACWFAGAQIPDRVLQRALEYLTRSQAASGKTIHLTSKVTGRGAVQVTGAKRAYHYSWGPVVARGWDYRGGLKPARDGQWNGVNAAATVCLGVIKDLLIKRGRLEPVTGQAIDVAFLSGLAAIQVNFTMSSAMRFMDVFRWKLMQSASLWGIFSNDDIDLEVAVAEHLLGTQQPDGSWGSLRETAAALAALGYRQVGVSEGMRPKGKIVASPYGEAGAAGEK